MAEYLLKLYVTGGTARSLTAIRNIQEICDQDLGGRFRLEVIDVLERPQLAENERIVATPTLIKQLPPPLRRLIGDLSRRDRVLLGLDLEEKSPEVR